jgi:hypothetical protein
MPLEREQRWRPATRPERSAGHRCRSTSTRTATRSPMSPCAERAHGVNLKLKSRGSVRRFAWCTRPAPRPRHARLHGHRVSAAGAYIAVVLPCRPDGISPPTTWPGIAERHPAPLDGTGARCQASVGS